MRLDQIAAQTWDKQRPIEETSLVIHDGARTPEELAARGKGYVEDLLFGNFSQAVPTKGAAILEIGSGLGWLMQAMNDYLVRIDRPAESITGLDIAPRMVEQAKERLGSSRPFGFLLYDGINVPLPDASLDLVYSAAALQHIPRPYVFNLFFEMKRLLKEDGFAIFHLISTAYLHIQEKYHSWKQEIQNQISGTEGHWHHFYTKQEIEDVLRVTGFEYVEVRDCVGGLGGSLVACASKLQLPNDFSAEGYLHFNEDLKNGNADPVRHWLQYGHREGRRWR